MTSKVEKVAAAEEGFDTLKKCVQFLRMFPQTALKTDEKLKGCLDAVAPLLKGADKDLIAQLTDALIKISADSKLKHHFEKVEQKVLETIEKSASECATGVLRSLCKHKDNLSVLLNRSHLIGSMRIFTLLTKASDNTGEDAKDKKNREDWIFMLQESLKRDQLNPTHFLTQANLEANVALSGEYLKFLSSFAKVNDLEKLKELAVALSATSGLQIDFEALRNRFEEPNQALNDKAKIEYLKQFFSVKKPEENGPDEDVGQTVAVERQIEAKESNECVVKEGCVKKKGCLLLVLMVISVLVALLAVAFMSGEVGDVLHLFFEEEKPSKDWYEFWK